MFLSQKQTNKQKSGKGLRKLLKVIDMLITLTVVMVSQVYVYFQAHHIVYFKYVHLVVYQLYLNKAV